jgi:threonine/homoserine/homoserine lactone efflux protein
MPSTSLTLALSSFALGILFCAPPGGVVAESIRRGMAGGFGPALRVQLGSLVGDATWALVALLGIAVLVQNDLARWVLGVAGVLLLGRLALRALSDGWHNRQPAQRAASPGSDFAVGAMLALANPYPVAFWLGVGSGTITSVIPQPAFADYALFFASFMFGAFLYSFFMAGLIAGGRQLMRPGFFRTVNFVVGVGLLIILWRLLQALLPGTG